MNTIKARARNAKPAASNKPKRTAAPSKVHPIIIYPFKPAGHYNDLASLYQLVERLDADKGLYARPITVMDRKTHYSMNGDRTFHKFRNNVVTKHSDILDAWCVDTCQMWYAGLGMAFERGNPGDVYWLIPGDFNYGTPVGQ